MTTTKKAVTKGMVAKNADANREISSPSKKTIKKVNAEQIQDVFVDGMSNLMAGPTTAKISFYTTINSNKTEETRKIALRLVMSTDVMIDMVEKLRTSIMKNEGTLSSGLDSHKNKTLGLVDKLKS
jgi:hypothetical protein